MAIIPYPLLTKIWLINWFLLFIFRIPLLLVNLCLHHLKLDNHTLKFFNFGLKSEDLFKNINLL